jgi:hypothetical protein
MGSPWSISDVVRQVVKMTRPTRDQRDLADVLEMVLDKGIVINADIVVTIGDTELLGIQIRAAIASFETAAKYGLAFPSGTDMRRVEQASGRRPLPTDVDLGIEASNGGSRPTDPRRYAPPPIKRSSREHAVEEVVGG